MLTIQYTGETLWPGQLGHAFILISFISCVFAAYAFYRDTSSDQNWNKLGRIGFYIHSFTTLGLIGIIFYLMIAQLYEYHYAWEHVSDDLQLRYIFSAFWEGQEGSFLLWMFWHIILGFFILRKRYKVESHVMAIYLLVQAWIGSMILGLYVGWGEYTYKIGSNPLLLLRDSMQAPIFSNPDYLEMIKGTGLNPLLQNYWMTIHPPTLFLGFASTTVPFAFAFGGLWKRDYSEWVSDVLKWSLFSACLLGTGILMGGAWAYEALSFGGYWAWDPVENMSLVPWLILVGGLHTNLISKASGYAVKSTYLLYSLSFVLILYSTFLTRSGVLGETSAHAFTEMGLEWQLAGFVLFFLFISLFLFARRIKEIPSPQNEESIYSREFWMFIGSIVLLFSGLIIAGSTSLPVINIIGSYFDPAYDGLVIEDPIPHYNKYQLWIAVLVTLLSSIALGLRFKAFGWENRKKKFITTNVALLGLSTLITYGMSYLIQFYEWRYFVLNVFCVFAILSNLFLLLPKNWKNLKSLAAASSHLGFGVMIIGSITSGLNQYHITSNPFVMQDIVADESMGKVVSLIKDEPFYSNGHWITYESDTIIDRTRFFNVHFRQVDENNKTISEYYTNPNVLFSNDLQKVASSNPGTKHFLSKDIFTTIASLPKSQIDVEMAKEEEDSLQYELYETTLNDTFFVKNAYGIVKAIHFEPTNPSYNKEENDLGIELKIEFKTLKGDSTYTVTPALGVSANLVYNYPTKIDELKLKVKLKDVLFENIFTQEPNLNYKEFKIKQGESFNYENYSFNLRNLKKEVTHPNYTKEEGDIAISANVVATNTTTKEIKELEPVYVIRGNSPLSVKEYMPKDGIHVRLTNIDPTTSTFTLAIAKDIRNNMILPIEIAQDVPRSDIIFLEAIVMPGINLFWLGSILMMVSFLLSFIARKTKK